MPSTHSWNDLEKRIRELESLIGSIGSSLLTKYWPIRQDFVKGPGYQTQYQVTSNQNGLISMAFDSLKIRTDLLGEVTGVDSKPLYDNAFPRNNSHLIKIIGIDPDGSVHLNNAPHSSYTGPVRIHLTYTLDPGVEINSYILEDIVEIDEVESIKFADDIAIEDTPNHFQGAVTIQQALTFIGQALQGYIFEEPAMVTTWFIQHNLGFKPSVTLVDQSDQIIFANVEYNNDNEITVTHQTPTAGKARLR